MTRLIRRGFIAGACVALSWTAPRVVRAQQPAVDVSGRWSLSIRTPDGEERRTLDLVMAKNGAITGSITAPLGTLDLSAGKLVGDSLHIEFAMAGGQIRVTYDGVVKSDSVRGVYRQEGYSGAFVGIRGEHAVRLPNENQLIRRAAVVGAWVRAATAIVPRTSLIRTPPMVRGQSARRARGSSTSIMTDWPLGRTASTPGRPSHS